jgi:phosphopantothenoylcysteine decarboxylase/phosphopantothenate--cysteine ligase
MDAVETALPADAAVMCAAVADWRVADASAQKLKKDKAATATSLSLIENPDILAWLCQKAKQRPPLIIGFAAETENVLEHALAKRARKQCDWLIANDVSESSEVMGGDFNTVHLITADGHENWARMSKADVAAELTYRVCQTLGAKGRSRMV